MGNLKLIGTKVNRHDAWAKARGEQNYSDDFEMPGMIYGKVVRSAHAAAIIKSIDVEEARNYPGVHCVLTAKDLMGNTDITKFGQMRDVGGGFEGLYKVLADGKIRYKSEPIALIAADTEEICYEAEQLIKVDYDVQEGVFTPQEALEPGAYKVSGDGEENLVMTSGVHRGDVEKAFKEADLIVENDYHIPHVDHAYLETEGGVAWIDDNGVVTMRVGTQVLEHCRTIARIMGLPHSRVRNMSVLMGGGFGGKEEITVETYLCMLAWYTRRPVKMVWSRQESLEAHCKRHPEWMHYKTGFKKDGTIVAQQVDITMDAGGYVYLTPWVQMYSTINAPGCYRIPNVDVKVRSALTNNMITSAYRGFGAVQVNMAYEQQMDEAAIRLGIDPVELRHINCLKNGDEFATGFIPEGHVALDELIDKAWNGLNDTYGPKKEYDEQGRKIGRGIAIGQLSYGRLTFMHDSSRVAIRIELDGSLTIRAGVPDHGQGASSAIISCACEELGLPVEKANIYVMDTHLTPYCGTSTASRQMYMSGNATLEAVRPLRKMVIKKAAELLGVGEEFVDLAHEKAYVINNPDDFVPFVEVIANLSNDGAHLESQGQFNAPFTEVPDLNNLRGRIHPDYTYSAHAVEVAVDEATGQYEVKHIVAALDVGRAINRNSCEGQMEGGAIHNMGYVNEDMGIEGYKGLTQGNKLSKYLIPTTLDAPHVDLRVVESGGGVGPYGAKGIGEPSANSIHSAILCALRDATGHRFKSMPVRPADILAAVMENEKKA